MFSLVAHPSRDLGGRLAFSKEPYMRTPARSSLRVASWSTDDTCALVKVGSASVRHKLEVCVRPRSSSTNWSFIHLNL